MRSMRFRVLLLLVLLLALAAPALAADGVLEINQTCAVQTGCVSGDAPGFPIVIDGSAGRSYRLSSDLVLANADAEAIRIFADHVTVDLAGFEIRGPVSCTGDPISCTPGIGFGSGISAAGSAGVSVQNGSIRGTGGPGVVVGSQGEVKGLRVRSNLGVGIFAFDGSTVSDSTAHANGGPGIVVSAGSVLADNTSFRNALDGIFAGEGSTVSGNSAYDNGGDGIEAQTGSTLVGNTVRLNGGFGLNLLSKSGYRENVITDNAAGTVNGTSLVNMGNNACEGSTSCP